jgi:DNA-binding transcriptional ArsR family regulator
MQNPPDIMNNLIEFFKILSERSRLDIINLLKEGQKTPTQIMETLNKSQSTISQQLKILQQANLISVDQEGVKKYYSIKSPELFKLLSHILAFVSGINQDKMENFTASEFMDILS